MTLFHFFRLINLMSDIENLTLKEGRSLDDSVDDDDASLFG